MTIGSGSNRHGNHELALRQDRERVVEQAKLRPVGLSKSQLGDRARNRRQHKANEEGRDQSPPLNPLERRTKGERRTCNICGVRGHLARNCTVPLSHHHPIPDRKEAEKKRQPMRRRNMPSCCFNVSPHLLSACNVAIPTALILLKRTRSVRTPLSSH